MGEFELSSITRSLMKADDKFDSGGENKEMFVHAICKFVPNSILKDSEEVNMSVIDTMQVVQKPQTLKYSLTLMVHCVTCLPLPGGEALIHSNNTDVFVLFVSLLQDLPCQAIIVKWYSDILIDLTKIYFELNQRSSVSIGHAVERFLGKSHRQRHRLRE